MNDWEVVLVKYVDVGLFFRCPAPVTAQHVSSRKDATEEGVVSDSLVCRATAASALQQRLGDEVSSKLHGGYAPPTQVAVASVLRGVDTIPHASWLDVEVALDEIHTVTIIFVPIQARKFKLIVEHRCTVLRQATQRHSYYFHSEGTVS